MTFYYALLLVFGAAVALLGIMAFLIRTDKKRDSKEYDFEKINNSLISKEKTREWFEERFEFLFNHYLGPIVLDADGINTLSEMDLSIIRSFKGNLILEMEL